MPDGARQITVKLTVQCGDRTQPAAIFRNKIKQINVLSDDQAILTWQDVLSMVRPALKGNGALFPAIAAFFRVSRA
ncbi:hypothetical protein ONR75_31120 [Rhodopseudomonas sp. P2A-2r]|uniref:hypothetical protein n=1 Tax=Rhodopseudomonas sp. P2A-2r TaxID=2991972 RepID=UPI0022346B8E|nr:hypothetical protein [Rhodopseudomonas sp. P2A-2r]UZE49102.1 hypothetical protein ONR75_31120 [Rhodopseudomonas sp. P2A-2r]